MTKMQQHTHISNKVVKCLKMPEVMQKSGM